MQANVVVSDCTEKRCVWPLLLRCRLNESQESAAADSTDAAQNALWHVWSGTLRGIFSHSKNGSPPSQSGPGWSKMAGFTGAI